MGQFFTPSVIASFMASLFDRYFPHVRILDPGTGMGTLFAALVHEMVERNPKPKTIKVTAYEIDAKLKPNLEETMILCEKMCRKHHIDFSGTILIEDFISSAIPESEHHLFYNSTYRFTHAILNPPYKKINGNSETRKYLDSAGIKTSNLYSAFFWLAVKLLEHGGEIVSITPRSFCNGPYFRSFRKALIDLVNIQRIHSFESRSDTFKNDSVLQENVIVHGIREQEKSSKITVSVSKDSNFSHIKLNEMSSDLIVSPTDKDAFIHLVEDNRAQKIMEKMSTLNTSISNLGLTVSTGRVVDFRVREFLCKNPEKGSVPLLYPCHFLKGLIRWPLPDNNKPNAVILTDETRDLLITSDFYVLTKRFSTKEESRRIIASVLEPTKFQTQLIGIENHLNYFHSHGKGISPNLAKGLALFLNTTLFDRYFRLFSGHTQVNATDLRKMRYPTHDQLIRMGNHVVTEMPHQNLIDDIFKTECGIYV
jgi:adenine-specific DNA-methyltransferase